MIAARILCACHAGDTAVFGDMKYSSERYKPDLALGTAPAFVAAMDESAVKVIVAEPGQTLEF